MLTTRLAPNEAQRRHQAGWVYAYHTLLREWREEDAHDATRARAVRLLRADLRNAGLRP